MEQTWRHVSARGAIVLISLESHFTDEKAGGLRAATYERLRRHWHFVNELRLFDIEDHKHYGIAVYGHHLRCASPKPPALPPGHSRSFFRP